MEKNRFTRQIQILKVGKYEIENENQMHMFGVCIIERR